MLAVGNIVAMSMMFLLMRSEVPFSPGLYGIVVRMAMPMLRHAIKLLRWTGITSRCLNGLAKVLDNFNFL